MLGVFLGIWQSVFKGGSSGGGGSPSGSMDFSSADNSGLLALLEDI